MTVPLFYFLIPFGLFILLFCIYAIFNFFHLARYGTHGQATFFLIILFLGGTMFLLGGSAILLGPTDWQEPVEIPVAGKWLKQINILDIPDVPLAPLPEKRL